MTDRTERVFNFLKEFIGENPYPPTVREVARGADISSTSVASYHLDKLVGSGHIRRVPNTARGIVLLEESYGNKQEE